MGSPSPQRRFPFHFAWSILTVLQSKQYKRAAIEAFNLLWNTVCYYEQDVGRSRLNNLKVVTSDYSNLLTPKSDQDRISPYSISTLSGRKVIRIKKNIN